MPELITHKLSHRDGERLQRKNTETNQWQVWSPVDAAWIDSYLVDFFDPCVSYEDTWSEPDLGFATRRS